jgi:hypothetical protein
MKHVKGGRGNFAPVLTGLCSWNSSNPSRKYRRSWRHIFCIPQILSADRVLPLRLSQSGQSGDSGYSCLSMASASNPSDVLDLQATSTPCFQFHFFFSCVLYSNISPLGSYYCYIKATQTLRPGMLLNRVLASVYLHPSPQPQATDKYSITWLLIAPIGNPLDALDL